MRINSGFSFQKACDLTTSGRMFSEVLCAQALGMVAIGFCVVSLGSCSTGPTPISRDILQRAPSQDILPQVAASSQSQDFGQTAVKESPKVGSFHFEWPVDDARMTRGFLPKKRKPHLGVDLAANKGTPIFAAQSGMVLYAGRDFRGYGRMVLVESGNGWATLYAHLDKILVDEGQSLTSKDVIGLMGRSGHATGVHLHFEIRKDKGPVDPLNYLPGGPKVAQGT